MPKCVNEAKDLRGGFHCAVAEYRKCRGSACPFYLTVEEAALRRDRANERLRSLSSEEQESISDKYYDGKMPWAPRA